MDHDERDEDERILEPTQGRHRLRHPVQAFGLKEPTVDLRYIKGYVYTINNEAFVAIAKGCKEMTNRMIYH